MDAGQRFGLQLSSFQEGAGRGGDGLLGARLGSGQKA